MFRPLVLALVALLAALGAPAPAPAADLATTRAILTREMGLAGASSGAVVRDLATGETLFAVAPEVPRVPASVEKLYTTATALLRDGPEGRLVTRALAGGRADPAGVLLGDLYLVGGGDPTLDRADLRLLARRIAAAGVTAVRGSVLGDASAFDALRGGPRTAGRYDPYLGGMLSGLVVDRGRRSGRLQRDPVTHAAAALAAELRRAGVRVGARAGRGVAPRKAPEVARVTSPPMRSLVRATNTPSDNYLAEMLLKGLGARFGRGGSTAGGAAVVGATLDDLGVLPRVADGSGLSRANRTTPADVVRLLEALPGGAAGDALAASLPIAGRTGTLRRRMRGTAAAGACRAKTGTLLGVSALAGYCRTRAGGDVAFAFLMGSVSLLGARGVQDRMASAVAAYDRPQGRRSAVESGR
jgi:D-alanyl-D-alanine carboxypeptidase/D-alanyl-D-alanine-endopeptidase (penicillin-binding protein 4)